MYIYLYIYIYKRSLNKIYLVFVEKLHMWGGVATISRLLKIIGLFCKEPYERDYILQKRPIILRSLLIVATTYLSGRTQTHRNTKL